jgi:hypothetical protein
VTKEFLDVGDVAMGRRPGWGGAAGGVNGVDLVSCGLKEFGVEVA